MASDAEKLCDIVACLGGPLYTNELDWATNIASGKALIEWIAAQLPSDDTDPRAALTRIALENEEVKLIRQSQTRPESDFKADLTKYISPSRKSSQITLLDNSAYTLENEIHLLQHRLQQTKIISQQLRKTAQVITTELARVHNGINGKQEELEQLSLQADLAISSTRSQAFDAFKCLKHSLRTDTTSASLANCLDSRSQIIHNVTEQLSRIDIWKEQLPDAKELKREALRLHNVLGIDKAGDSSLLSSAEEAAYYQQLQLLIKSLEEVHGDDGEIYDVLQEVGTVTDQPSRTPEISKELETAWNTDQLIMLQARAAALDKASSQLQQSILPPLQDLNAHLEQHQITLRETLSILRGFGQIMEDISRDLDAANAKTHNSPSLNDHDDHPSLEHELNALLKELETLRSSDALPLVLLNQNDVSAELSALKQRERSLGAQEEEWCSSMPIALNSMMSMHDPVLCATYAHSAVNTSVPYGLSPSVTTLQRDAKLKSDALTSEVQRLQKDLTILEDERTQRKLKSFVER